ncbi:hypothetical protein G3A50_04570 [Ancylobacter pratisalsi]|uniref:Uncharacterized protein n=1 Tax=Ancylobacter pratisalsi TaxID=1745854 RepID=A0A6P1YK23_9HYPH|nr:hypothetical protein [Ancylobacter pratisalsi]QIB33066.1 hypothetical protein G3A50_04570 [Ancylobacter pratisalsi]
MAAISRHPLRLSQLVEQGHRASIIADLARRDEEAQGAGIGIGDGVHLGVHAATDPAGQAAEIPFLPQGWKPCGGLETGRIERDGLGFGPLGG